MAVRPSPAKWLMLLVGSTGHDKHCGLLPQSDGDDTGGGLEAQAVTEAAVAMSADHPNVVATWW